MPAPTIATRFIGFPLAEWVSAPCPGPRAGFDRPQARSFLPHRRLCPPEAAQVPQGVAHRPFPGALGELIPGSVAGEAAPADLHGAEQPHALAEVEGHRAHLGDLAPVR